MKIEIKELSDIQEIEAKRYYISYSIVFFILLIFIFSTFIYYGKSFVFAGPEGGADGLVQHYNSFLYYGKYLRSIIRTLIYEHKFIIPMWDMSIGYGQDILTTLSYYVIGDPFSFLSVLFPTKFSEIGYHIAIILRIYCSGITFSFYLRSRGHKTYYTLIGAIIYVFCHYTLIASLMHPYFMLPMVYLPIILVGIDREYKYRSGQLYIIIIALSAISNFYFFYMLIILAILYAITMYCYYNKNRSFKCFIIWTLRFIALTLIGIAISAVLILPTITNLMNSSRIGINNYVPLLYDLDYYIRTISSFMSGGFGNYSYMGYTPIGLCSVVILFMNKNRVREWRYLCVSFILLIFFFCLPFAGHLFNGFSYVTNRWCWALAMLVSYIVVAVLPTISRMTIIQLKQLILISGTVVLIPFFFYKIRSERFLLSIIELIIVYYIIYTCILNNKTNKTIRQITLITVVALIGNAYYLYSPNEENYLKNFADNCKAYNMLTRDSPTYLMEKVEDAATCRFDTSGIPAGELKRNSAMALDENGIAFYFSTTNPDVNEFNRDLMLNYSMEHTYNNLDNRLALQLLTGVKYLISPTNSVEYLSETYNNYILKNSRYSLYKTELNLPLGFATDRYVSRSQFDACSIVDKERLLLSSVVVEDNDIYRGSPEFQLKDAIAEKKYKLSPQKGIVCKETSWVVTDVNSKLRIDVNVPRDEILYCCINGLDFEGINPYQTELQSTKKFSRYEYITKRREMNAWKEPSEARIDFNTQGHSTSITYRTTRDNYYARRDSFVANLNSSKEERTSITLSFSQPGVYSYSDLSILTIPRASIEECARKLPKQSIRDLTFDINSISGNIELDSPAYVCLQVPYSSGWHAVVDGEDAEILKEDIMFMGLYLPAGDHKIGFYYQTPYYIEGCIVSFCGAIVFVVYSFHKRHKYLSLT